MLSRGAATWFVEIMIIGVRITPGVAHAVQEDDWWVGGVANDRIADESELWRKEAGAEKQRREHQKEVDPSIALALGPKENPRTLR